MTAALLLFLLAGAGAPLALLLCGPRAEALPLAPLLGAGLLSLGATVEVAVGGPQLVLATTVLVLGALLSALVLLLRRPAVRPLRPVVEGLLLLGPVMALGWTLSTLHRVHVSYDGRSIWFFHARMLVGGHAVYLDQARAFPFSHPDYPPMVPATVALGWRLAGFIDYRTGQLTVAALTACATVLACLGVSRALEWSGVRGALVAGAGVGMLYGAWDEYATNGFVDPLCAALVVGAMVHGLLVPPAQRRTPLALALLVLAAMLKNEGLTFSLVVLGAVFLRQALGSAAAGRLRARSFAGCLGLVLAWPVVVHLRGVSSDLTRGMRPPGSDNRPAARAGLVLERLPHFLPGVALGFGIAAVAMLLVGARQRGRILLYLLAQLTCGALLLGVYAFGPLEIHYWIDSSLQRTSMTLHSGGLLAGLYALGVGCAWAGRNVLPRRVDARRESDVLRADSVALLD